VKLNRIDVTPILGRITHFCRRQIGFFGFHPESQKDNHPKNPVNPVQKIISFFLNLIALDI
jgi:hypothetical protein